MATAAAASNGQFSVVLWEWSNDHGLWEPYEKDIVDYIEDRFQAADFTPFSLGGISRSMSLREITLSSTSALPSGTQRNTQTGHVRSIRRTIVSSTNPGGIADGVWWRWQADLRPWEYYPTSISQAIEERYQALNQQSGGAVPKLDLQVYSRKCPYVIDVVAQTQINKNTGFTRAISRATVRQYRKTPSSLQAPSTPAQAPSTTAQAPTFSSQAPSTTAQAAQLASFRHQLQQPQQQIHSGSASSIFSSSTNMQPAPLGFPVNPLANSFLQHVQNVIGGNISGLHNMPGVILSSSSITAPAFTAATSTAASAASNVDGSWRISHPAPSRRENTVYNNAIDQNSNPSNDVVTLYTNVVAPEEVRSKMDKENCNICLNELTEESGFTQTNDKTVVRLSKCKHAFHKECLKSLHASGGDDKSLRCPYCKATHGVRTGICPDGYLTYVSSRDFYGLGFPDATDMLTIKYHINGGVQGPQHPNPGQNYVAVGFPRTGFLPDNAKGRLVLQLLIVAWERRLTFTVGRSVTTSADNSVIWNEIHHKTQAPGHRYPDPDYLDRVIDELAAQGVREDDLPAAQSASSSSGPPAAKAPRLH